MSWLALFLLGVGVSDLVFSVRPMRHVPEAVGATLAVGVGLLCGLTAGRDLAALLVVALLVVAWGQTVTRGFAAGGRAWLPLSVFGGGLVLGIALSPLATPADGLLADWLAVTPVGVLAGLSADVTLVLTAVLLVQLSTGNVLVRLVLAATGTVDPSRTPGGRDVPSYRLKGGRLLGPMERLFIVGLGIAGQLTAASVVIAAKGLLRWPELQASRTEHGRGGIHAVTEYFLVGSFVSWMVALGSLVLLR